MYLLKVTPITLGVNFSNVLQAAFAKADPKSTNNTAKSSVSFALLGSEPVKGAHRTLMKLTPGEEWGQ